MPYGLYPRYHAALIPVAVYVSLQCSTFKKIVSKSQGHYLEVDLHVMRCDIKQQCTLRIKIFVATAIFVYLVSKGKRSYNLYWLYTFTCISIKQIAIVQLIINFHRIRKFQLFSSVIFFYPNFYKFSWPSPLPRYLDRPFPTNEWILVAKFQFLKIQY